MLAVVTSGAHGLQIIRGVEQRSVSVVFHLVIDDVRQLTTLDTERMLYQVGASHPTPDRCVVEGVVLGPVMIVVVSRDLASMLITVSRTSWHELHAS